MVEERELDIIAKAHLAAERLEKANKEKEILVARMEEVEKRAEGNRLLGGESSAGSPPPKEMTEEEKIRIHTKTFWKGTALEGYFQ